MTGSQAPVSAIVPVFNEQASVATVVETLLDSSAIDEVVCVNDGSTDRSLDLLRQFGDRIILVDVQPNRGKGHALAEGVRRASGEIVAFFDADLTNLSSQHITALIEPVRRGDARAALGCAGGDFVFSIVSVLVPGAADSIGVTFTGQRAYARQDLLPHLPRMTSTRFGVEVYLNDAFSRADSAIVPLPGLAALGKQDKHGWPIAVREYSGEVLEVSREMARTGWARFAGAVGGNL